MHMTAHRTVSCHTQCRRAHRAAARDREQAQVRNSAGWERQQAGQPGQALLAPTRARRSGPASGHTSSAARALGCTAAAPCRPPHATTPRTSLTTLTTCTQQAAGQAAAVGWSTAGGAKLLRCCCRWTLLNSSGCCMQSTSVAAWPRARVRIHAHCAHAASAGCRDEERQAFATVSLEPAGGQQVLQQYSAGSQGSPIAWAASGRAGSRWCVEAACSVVYAASADSAGSSLSGMV